jgi:ketosteroid isomerase-like protein
MKTTFLNPTGSVLTFAVLIASFAMLTFGCQPRSSDSDPAKAATDISNRISGYLDALKRRDVQAAGEYWTEDSRLIGPGIDLDRSQLLEGLRSAFAAGTQVNVLKRPTIEFFVHGDFTYEIAQAEEVFLNPGTTSPDTIRNNLFIRWEKGSDGEWRFDRVLLSPQTSM